MTIVEVFLILVGVSMIVCSFFVSEKLSGKDLKNISDYSEKEIKIIMEKRMSEAEAQIDDMVNKAVDLSLNKINRELNKETDDKIMAIGEYSETVMDSLTKTHSEVTFLYSMLGDKHDELVKETAEVSELLTSLRECERTARETALKAAALVSDNGGSVNIRANTAPVITADNKNSDRKDAPAASAGSSALPENTREETGNFNEADDADETAEALKNELSQVMAAPVKEDSSDSSDPSEKDEDADHNDDIIRLYKSGMEPVDIAKELSIGIGEVSLVIDLYQK